VTCYVLFFIYLESSRIDISRITNCANEPWKLPVTRNVRIRGRGTRPLRYALHDRDRIYFTSCQATRAPPVRSLSVGPDAESSVGSPKNECLSKVVLFGDRHRMTPSCPERNHQEKSTIILLWQIAEVRCEEEARCRERLGDPSLFYHQDAA
jgi:putative transposase